MWHLLGNWHYENHHYLTWWIVNVDSYLFEIYIQIIIRWCYIKCCYMANTCNMLIFDTCLSMLIIWVVWVKFIQLHFIYSVPDIRYIWSLIMIILSNHLFCVCVGFGIHILMLCVRRGLSTWWSSAFIVYRLLYLLYIESFILLSYCI
jgi:hypothetical protein